MAKNIWGKRCDRCGKGIAYLMNVSHSHIRTNSKSLPNLHKTTLTIGGETRQFRFCTKCLRIMKSSFAKVQGQANKIVAEAQKIEAPKVEVAPIVTSVVEEAPVVTEITEEEPKKAKKTAKPKAKAGKETSRKKALTDLIAGDDEV